MKVETTRFGTLTIADEEQIVFADGLCGFEDCTGWVLLADGHNDAVAWLQSTERPEVALALVSPRNFAPDYRLRTPKKELAPLDIEPSDQVFVLAIVARNAGRLTLNLKAPVVINLDRRLGRQVLASDDQPLQYEMAKQASRLRKSA